VASFLSRPETFLVEELPAYLPQGEGPHTFGWMEKRDLTTLEAVRRVARLLGVDPREIGYAGMKDRHALTRQWISVLEVPPERLLEVTMPELRFLEAKRHRNKLRMGHLAGNRFEVVLEEVAPGEADSLSKAFLDLARTGVPNYYGHQRFGVAGDNVAVGLAVLRGTRREPDARKRKLFQSAVQSAVFNQVLALRAQTQGLLTVIEGDILEVASGGRFVCVDPSVDQPRVDAGEVVPTAPMPGNRTMTPPPGTAAARLEEEAMRLLGVTPEDLLPLGRALPGTRRPVVAKVGLGEHPLEAREGALVLRFSLPAGSYATVLLDVLGVAQRPASRPVLASDARPSE
jgi:tRNA pseudouridine13 synthase